jgi:hypothetical protein
MFRLIFVISCIFVFFVCSALAQTPTPTPPSSEVKDERHSWIDATAIWKDPSGLVRTKIPVCWENPDLKFNNQMLSVRRAITDSWEYASAVRFTGWEKCAEENSGIHILIDDAANNGPHTKGLGNRLDRKKDGMVLNFTFQNWKPACGFPIDTCIKAIAVHEFGHALGFAHEHNRADRPGECDKSTQGSNGTLILTPYDPDSVMNYCFEKNDGTLSKYDKEGVSAVYGFPKNESPQMNLQNKSRNKSRN